VSNLARAYSFIEIKAADDASRIIEGLATTPSPDRSQDIVRPMGAKFSLPLPFLWQHRHDEPVGHVIDVDPKPSGIRFKAKIEKTDEPGKLKDRLDEAWLSLQLKLVRATSIGFRPLKYSFIENGGIDFEEWDWLELSAVTIPANPDAAITAVKQLDRVFREALGIPDLVFPQPDTLAATGKTARVVKLNDPARERAKPFVINRIVRP